MSDNRSDKTNYFFANPTRKEIFTKKTRKKTTRKETRKRLKELKLAVTLSKVINHFFPGLLPALARVNDPRNASYITYSGKVILMTRILSSVFYISSMRKSSEEFNSDKVIQNIGYLCNEELEELPYWETINNYLKRINPDELQNIIIELVKRLIRSRAFEEGRIRNRYWQIVMDGTGLCSSRKELDGKSLYKVYNKGTEEKYTEYLYYVLEAKLILRENVVVSIMTEFVDNEGKELEKQDCELTAAKRLMKRLKEEFSMLPICISADSLYASETILKECKEKGWKYLLRFKEGSVPSIYEEYESLKKYKENEGSEVRNGKKISWNHETEIDYRGYSVNFVEYREEEEAPKEKEEKGKAAEKKFYFITDLPIKKGQAVEVAEYGRRRWKIENEGFNTQKRQGYNLEHRYSHNYQATKNHYYLIQIGHMIAQIIEGWKKIWEGIQQSREQKHRRMLENFKVVDLKEYKEEIQEQCQIRFE